MKQRNRIKHDNTQSSEIIKDIIRLGGLKTPKEVSEVTSFSASSIGEWIRGDHSPQLASVLLLAKELNVDFWQPTLNVIKKQE